MALAFLFVNAPTPLVVGAFAIGGAALGGGWAALGQDRRLINRELDLLGTGERVAGTVTSIEASIAGFEQNQPLHELFVLGDNGRRYTSRAAEFQTGDWAAGDRLFVYVDAADPSRYTVDLLSKGEPELPPRPERPALPADGQFGQD